MAVYNMDTVILILNSSQAQLQLWDLHAVTFRVSEGAP